MNEAIALDLEPGQSTLLVAESIWAAAASELEQERAPASAPSTDNAAAPDAAARTYRFSWPPASAGRGEAWLEVGSLYGRYTLWLNGNRAADAPSWGAPSRHRVTDHLATGTNELSLAAAPAPLSAAEWPEVALAVTGSVWIHSLAVHANLSIDGSEAALAVVTELGSAERMPILAHLTVSESSLPAARSSDQITVSGETGLVQSIVIPRVAKWFPREAGRPSLYSVELVVTDLAGNLLDRRQTPLGVRRIDPADEGGQDGDLPTRLLVNGVELPVRGATLGERPARTECEAVVRSALDGGLTLLRLPAAAAPAPAALFEAADRLGLLLWQELPDRRLHPGEDPSDAVAALVAQRRGHPSLAAWGCPGAGDLFEAHSRALDWEDPERLRWTAERLAAPASRLSLEVEQVRDPWLRELFQAQLALMALQAARVEGRPLVLAAPIRLAAPESEAPLEVSILQSAWQSLAPIAGLERLDWSAEAQFRVPVRLANDGEACSLLNVVARVLDMDGRELYSENLAGEAPARETEEVGELVWRFPAALEGLLTLLVELIDEEGDVLGSSSYLFWRGEPTAALPPPQLAIEQRAGGSWFVRNRAQSPALGVSVRRSGAARGVITLPGSECLEAPDGEGCLRAWASGGLVISAGHEPDDRISPEAEDAAR